MPIDASIYGMLQQPKPMAGPLDQFGQVLQLKHLMDSGQLNALQRKQLETQIDEDVAVKQAFSGMQPGQTIGDILPGVMRASPKTGLALQKSHLESQQASAGLEKTRAETQAVHVKTLRDITAGVQNDAQLANLREQTTRLFGPQVAAEIPQSVNAPNFAQWKQNAVMTSDEFLKREFPQLTMTNLGGTVQPTHPYTGRPAGQALPTSMSPGDTARVAELQAGNAQQERIAAERLRYETGVDVPARQVQIGTPTAAPVQRTPPAQPAPAPQVAPDGLTPKARAEVAAKEAERTKEVGRTLNAYVAARNGLLSGLGGSETGPIAGRVPAFTSNQQIAEGAVAAMAPVLKQLFRVAGEGVFTDRDQQLLLDMVPKRADTPEARKTKMENIDQIVAAKLGMEVPKPPALDAEAGKPKTFDALPDPAQFKGRRVKGDDGTIYRSDGARWVRE